VTTVKGRLYESRKRLKAIVSKEVVPIMKDVLKSQAPKEDFPDKIMEILSKMEDSANAIKNVYFTVEDHFGGWVYYTPVAYASPNLWRVESENAVFVCNGENIWCYDKTLKLVHVSTVDEPDRPIIPQWTGRGMFGMREYIPQLHFLFTREGINGGYELKLEESNKMHILKMTKPKRHVLDRAYFFHELSGYPDISYSFFTWEIPQKENEKMLLGIDARTYLPLLQEGDYRFGKIEVKKIDTFGEGIFFPTEFHLLKGERHIIRYTDVHVNEHIAPSRFALDIPQNVVILNSDDFKDIEASIVRYEDMLNKGKLDKATKIRCLYTLSCLYRERGHTQEDYTKAARLLERICQIDKSIPVVYRALFNAYYSRDMLQKSIEALEMGEKYASHPNNLKLLALSHRLLDREERQPCMLAKALEYRKRLLEVCDSDDKILQAEWLCCDAVDAGICLKSLISFYEDKLSSESNEPYLWKLLGILYCQTGEPDKATPYCKRYIQWHKEHMPGVTLKLSEDRNINAPELLVELADFYQTLLQNIPQDMLGTEIIEGVGGQAPIWNLLELYFRLQDFSNLASIFRQICYYGARFISVLGGQAFPPKPPFLFVWGSTLSHGEEVAICQFVNS